jgi:transcriptional regulator GlxA family with amidase domain
MREIDTDTTATTTIAFPIYEGFAALDAIGPYEVLARYPGAELVFCALEAGPTRTDTGGLTVIAERSLDEVAAPDVVVVPGGYGNRSLLEPDGPYVSWLRGAHETSTWTASVCTGSLLLAAAGILDGLEATTHWAARETLGELGAEPVAERVVFHPQERIVTAAGVSSGIDMALRLIDRMLGAPAAQAIQLGIEYDPDPPHDAGSIEKAPAEIVEFVRAALDAEDERTAAMLTG